MVDFVGKIPDQRETCLGQLIGEYRLKKMTTRIIALTKEEVAGIVIGYSVVCCAPRSRLLLGRALWLH